MNPLPAMQEPHRPSKKTAILFFIFTLTVAAFVVAWVFFINKGEIELTGGFPFNANVNGVNLKCNSAPCKISLSPKTYKVTLQKNGFFDDAQMVQVRRWQTLQVKANFKFKPVVREIEQFVLPVDTAPLRPPFIGLKRFENFPKEAKDVQFSASAKLAFFHLGKETYFYDVEKKQTLKTAIAAATPKTWLGENIVTLDSGKDGQSLNIGKDGKKTLIAAFKRPLENVKLFGDPSGKKVLIQEEPNWKNFYIVDTEKKSRAKLNMSLTATGIELTPWRIIFWVESMVDVGGSKSDGLRHLRDFDDLGELTLPALNNIIEPRKNVFVFISQNASGEKEATTIEEALKQTKEEMAATFSNTTLGSKFYIVELDKNSGAAKTLAEIEAKEGEGTPYSLTFSPDFKKLYFRKGKKAFEAVLEP